VTAELTERAPAHASGVNRIDHFVVEVNDLWRSYEFYRDILGAEAYQVAGMDTERLRHRGNQIVFLRIAGHMGVGLALSNVAVPPVTRPFEHVTQGYEVSDAQLEQLERLLDSKGVDSYGPETYADGFPFARRLWFQDPDGHTIEVCVRPNEKREPDGNSPAPGGPVVPARISHMGIEVRDVARTARWFEDTLGFAPLAEHGSEVYLQVRGGDQMLVLRPADSLSPRRDYVRGPHIDFEAPPAAYPALRARIDSIEGYFEDAPHPFPNPRGADADVTIYFCDPDGNRFQLSPAGGH